MSEETEKAIKAIEAAIRKAGRAGIGVKVYYTITHEDGSTETVITNTRDEK